jgi:hypothetical protein
MSMSMSMSKRKRYPVSLKKEVIKKAKEPNIIRNSWRHRGFSYFSAEPEVMVSVVKADNLLGDNNDNHFDDDDDDDSLIDESPFTSTI